MSDPEGTVVEELAAETHVGRQLRLVRKTMPSPNPGGRPYVALFAYLDDRTVPMSAAIRADLEAGRTGKAMRWLRLKAEKQ